MVDNIENPLYYNAFKSDHSASMLLLVLLFVLLMHLLGYFLLSSSNPPQQVAATPKPFKLEVSMLPSPETINNKPTTLPSEKQKTKEIPKRQPEKKPPDKQKSEDYAALEQLLNSQPRQPLTRAFKTQANSRSVQTVSSSMLHSRPKTPHTIDNFPESDEHNISPDYPDMAIFLGYQGTAVVRVNISAKGLSQGVELLRTSGHKILDDSVTKALKQWRFTATNQADSVIIVVNYSIR